MPARRYYVGTSVFGGCFEAGWEESSKALLQFARDGRVRLLTSVIVTAELKSAPEHVRRIAAGLPTAAIDEVQVTEEVLRLRDAYLEARVVAARATADATHVALATVARADAIVSWNFRDLVREDHIKGFNCVNLAAGYGLMMIVSPQGVRFDEDEEG